MSNPKPATPREYPKFWLSALTDEALEAKLPFPVEFVDQSIRQLLSKPMGVVGQLTLVFAAFSLSNTKERMNSKMHQLLLKLGVRVTGLEVHQYQGLTILEAAPKPASAAAPEASSLDDDLRDAGAELATHRGSVRATGTRRTGQDPEEDATQDGAPAASAAPREDEAHSDEDPDDHEGEEKLDDRTLPADGLESPEEKKMRLLRRLNSKSDPIHGGGVQSAHSVSSATSSVRALRNDFNGFKTNTTEVLNQILDAVARLSNGSAQGQKRQAPATTDEPAQKTHRTSDKDKPARQGDAAAPKTGFTPPVPAPWSASASAAAAETAEEDYVGQVSPLYLYLSFLWRGEEWRASGGARPSHRGIDSDRV